MPNYASSLSVLAGMLFAVLGVTIPLCGVAQAQTPSPPSGPLAAKLQPFVDSHTLAGAVLLVANRDEVLTLETVGYADLAARRPMPADAMFWIASMTKPMTATAVMMLVDEGKLNLDDPVEKYLPEFRGQMVAVERDDTHVLLNRPVHPITIREVLSHTSGLPFMSRVEQKIDTRPLREAVLSYALTSLQSQPGTKFDYSNAGISTAGRIVEVLSGMPYETFMEQRLFGPLGMHDTTFWPNEEQVSRLAKSYMPNAEKNGLVETDVCQATYPLTDRGRGPCPAGGLFSTARDVAQFCRMILGGGVLDGRRYVSEDAIRQMGSTQTGALLNNGQGENGYGLGWWTTGKCPSDAALSALPAFGHGGAYATNMSIDLPHGLVTVFMVQHAGFPGPDGPRVYPTFAEAALERFGK